MDSHADAVLGRHTYYMCYAFRGADVQPVSPKFNTSSLESMPFWSVSNSRYFATRPRRVIGRRGAQAQDTTEGQAPCRRVARGRRPFARLCAAILTGGGKASIQTRSGIKVTQLNSTSCPGDHVDQSNVEQSARENVAVVGAFVRSIAWPCYHRL